ncbi:MAG: hypothetical protein K9G38_02840 [Bacteroidales bacterium]|nr:hypothetical protein [Bacteroidales bacterium]
MTLEYIIGIGFPLLLIIISGHIIWKSTDSFEVAADYLGRKMSHGVKGATLNAVASSMPEFLTTMFFLFYIKNEDVFADSFSGGLGVVAGSAVFNILVIPLTIILFGGILLHGGLRIQKSVIKRDGVFLVLLNIILIVIVAQQELKAYHALILVFSYLIYLGLLRKGMGLGVSNEPADRSKYQIPAVRLTARHFLLLDLKKLLLNGRQMNRITAWSTLLISTAVMSVGTWMLVEGTKLLGEKSYGEDGCIANLLGLQAFHGLGIPVVFLSVLLAAAATSIPDTMISVRDSRKGNHDDAISNAIGSNIFDISFAIGFPLLLYTLIHGNVIMSEQIQLLSFGILIAMWFINIAVVLLFIPRKMNIRLRAALLLLLYLLFIIFIISERNENITHLFESMINAIQQIL